MPSFKPAGPVKHTSRKLISNSVRTSATTSAMYCGGNIFNQLVKAARWMNIKGSSLSTSNRLAMDSDEAASSASSSASVRYSRSFALLACRSAIRA
ncbi:hypothetical protein D3C76_1357810 [compost metagenome]